MYSCYNTFIVKKYKLYMDMVKGMLLSQIYPMKLINVSVSSKHCHLPHPVQPLGGGTCQNFDRDARPIFLGLKFGQILFLWIGKFFSYFSGFRKISAIFWV